RDREETVTGELVRDARLARVEAALFAADEPLAARKLVAAADLADAGEARRLIEKLKEFYNQDGTAFQIEELAGGFQVRTRPAFHTWLVRLRRSNPDPK